MTVGYKLVRVWQSEEPRRFRILTRLFGTRTVVHEDTVGAAQDVYLSRQLNRPGAMHLTLRDPLDSLSFAPFSNAEELPEVSGEPID